MKDTCPKCKYPLTTRTSRPATKQGEREVYLRCDQCKHKEKVTR